MASSNRQKLKLLYLIKMLQDETDPERGLSMTEILARLAAQGIDAERKSIYRDIEVLREVGMDIQTYQRCPVEYALVREGLGIDEVMLLVDAVQSSKFLTETKSRQLVKALKGLVSEREAKLLSKRVHVDGRVKSQQDSVFHSVDTIHEAMRQKRKVSFLYFKHGTDMGSKIQHEGKPYVETPVKLVFQDGFYYLAAFNDKHDDFVTYRVDRMRIVQVSDEKATRNERIANYGFEQFEHQAFGMFDGEKATVTLLVQEPLMGAVADRFGSDAVLGKRTDEEAEVRVTVRVSPQFFGWIAGMDGNITIAGPQVVKDEYKEWLNKLMGGC
ncbi:helix-turn-helix transcriptional regulator [Ellagibacter isourolithinifaciens]|uniref:helix-turn-helix transcriptional regulator n=1 Tax=Ellagibacter isourolithinifaciens TaxID=2137581 RepID=UPI003AAD6904